MKKLAFLLMLFLPFAAGATDEPSVLWTAEARSLDGQRQEIILTGAIGEGFHIPPPGEGGYPTSIVITPQDGCTLEGSLEERSERQSVQGEPVFMGTAVLAQQVRMQAPTAHVHIRIEWQGCRDEACGMPEETELDMVLEGGPDSADSSLLALVLEAILWGLAMLLTPCVFPMVPMTVSFFLKGASSPAAGRFKALMYGLFIILLYTVPICVIILLTRLLGGGTVTADLFNWLATHWFPNLLFFLIFMIFAASFFGAFEITLPAALVNKSDKNSDRKGLAGVFFMALTLVLVSFSCTGPIVGTVLIKSTRGEFWTPMVTMLAFSTAFALPFTLLALFPALLKKLPRSGGWLQSVKVVLGFIELALGLKFLSVADQTYHWHILDREIYLALWIVIFALLGAYLLGKIRFYDEEKTERIGVTRLALAILDLAFVVYLIPGMWGAPLKALSGYLPPLETQDFVMGSVPAATPVPDGTGTTIRLAQGLQGYATLEEGLQAARESGKPVFLDITGHGCVNCREMEQRVWSAPQVRQLLAEAFVIVALYTDDKTLLPEKDWVRTEDGKVFKDRGRVNAWLARTRFGVNAQPTYLILSPEGEIKAGPYAYNLSVPDFVAFLDQR